jgi:phosphatidylinositol alpha-mannosyltransferase
MYAESEPGVSRAARRALANLMFPALGAGIAVSPAAADYAGRVWKRPLHVIPNGVPTGMFHPPEAGPKATNGAGHAPLKLLFVGNWRDPRKGLPVLLDAHRRLLESGERVSLDIVGRGKPSARQSGIPGVTFHGPIEDDRSLADHYRSCDVFVSPATGQESFGIVLLEAMACGRPVVCSDIRGYRDVADREGACLVAPGDAVALAQAIRALAGDSERRARMGERNLAAAQRYGWDTIAQRVRDVYHEALAARAAE